MSTNVSRVPEKGKTATAAPLVASSNSSPFLLERLNGFSLMLVVTETTPSLTGTIKLQASNNAFKDNTNNETNSSASWADITSSSVSVSGTGVFFWNVTDVYYEAVRFVWTNATGDGNVSAYFLAKEH